VPVTTVQKVPYTVTQYQTQVVKTQVPYTVVRCCSGAWVDAQGVAHGDSGVSGCVSNVAPGTPNSAGRTFQCGASYTTTWTTNSCRMVPEVVKKQVPYTVWQNVTEQHVKTVPYTVCRMVPHTIKKQVPYTVCEMVPCTYTKK